MNDNIYEKLDVNLIKYGLFYMKKLQRLCVILGKNHEGFIHIRTVHVCLCMTTSFSCVNFFYDFKILIRPDRSLYMNYIAQRRSSSTFRKISRYFRDRDFNHFKDLLPKCKGDQKEFIRRSKDTRLL